MATLRGMSALVLSSVVAAGGCRSGSLDHLADPTIEYTSHSLDLRQELVNDAPIGPGEPQPSSHCPTGPGQWIAGSGRSTGSSSLFGDLTEVEVYCVNVDRTELSGGLSTWTDTEGDTISMSFGVKHLVGFVYAEAPRASLVGFANFTGGTGKWAGLTGAALVTGKENGDGTVTLDYAGTVYLPR